MQNLFIICFGSVQKLETLGLIHLFSVLYQRFLLGAFFYFLWYIILEADWSMEDIGLAIIIAWALWSNRNEVIHGKPRKAGLKLVDWCKNYLDEYWSANRTLVNPPTHLEVAWSPSIFPSYKVNVDAARFMAQKAVGAGVIIRDHEGKFIAGLSKKFHAPLGIVEAEAKAFEAGIIFAKEVGIRDLVLEGSLIVIQVLKQVSNAPSTVSSLIYGMLAECNEFRKVSFSHVKSQGNKPAQLLAKQALGLDDFSAWIEECPCFLEQALVHNVSVSLSS